jgi:hypothetical protein
MFLVRQRSHRHLIINLVPHQQDKKRKIKKVVVD